MNTVPDETVFLYRPLREAFFMLIKLAFTLGFAGSAYFLYTAGYQKSGDQESLYLSLFLALGALIAVLRWGNSVVNLIYSKSNRIVFTNTAVMKYWRGQTEEYPYQQIQNLKINYTQGKNTQYNQSFSKMALEFTDGRNNRTVELAKNNVFGPVLDIFTLLQKKTGTTTINMKVQ